MKLLLFNILLLFSSLIFCQNQKFNYNYIPLKSIGEIPADFKKLATEKYNEDISSNSDNKSPLKSEEKKFYSFSHYEINQTLFSGRVLFGDNITNYLNKILDELLKNDSTLRDKFRIYTFKSSSVNAACTSDGTIFINIGLLPYLKNEAELAFIISHEISHFVKKHSLNSYIEKTEILENKESFDQKINKLFTQSKEKEFEADSLGVLLFLKSTYNTSAINNALDILYYSYLPYKETSFDRTFFNSENFEIPSSYFLDSLTPISPIGEFDDRYLTHPNILKRKAKVSEILEQQKHNGSKDYIVSKNTFEQIQEQSKFENIRLCILQKGYGNVIYYSYELLQQYPDNKYLKIAICKALYGLAKYKNLDKYHKVAKSYHQTEGEIQQIHYLLRNLNTIQINVLAINYIQKTLKSNPNNIFIKKLMNNLIEDMVLIHRINVVEDFNKNFDKDITNDKKLFYKNAFANEITNKAFVNEFEKHYKKLDSLKKWDNMNYKEKIKIQEQAEKNIAKNGLQINVKKIIVLDPIYQVYYKGNGNYIEAEKKKDEFDNQIIDLGKEFNFPIELVNSKKLSSKKLSSYNDLSMLKEWLNERWSHEDKNIIPLFSDQIEGVLQKYNTQYLCNIGIYENPPYSYYFLLLYDLNSGTIKYKNYQDSKKISTRESYRFFKKDIEFIKK